MQIKPQLKSYSFWFGLASAVMLLIQSIGEPLGLNLNEQRYMAIVNAILGIFVVLGIISNPSIKNETKTDEKKENIDYENKENFDKIDSITQENIKEK